MNVIYIVLAYLIGSIPFGLIITRLAGKEDIRNVGSGNIGATNVLRAGHKWLALTTLILDMAKGMTAVFIAYNAGEVSVVFAAALASVLGHMYPPWLKFRGGKGVATALGVMLGLMPVLGAAMLGVWLLAFACFRISSLAALTVFALAPLLSWFWLGDMKLALLGIIIAALIFWRHRKNIRRLMAGEETRIRFGGKS